MRIWRTFDVRKSAFSDPERASLRQAVRFLLGRLARLDAWCESVVEQRRAHDALARRVEELEELRDRVRHLELCHELPTGEEVANALAESVDRLASMSRLSSPFGERDVRGEEERLRELTAYAARRGWLPRNGEQES